MQFIELFELKLIYLLEKHFLFLCKTPKYIDHLD